MTHTALQHEGVVINRGSACGKIKILNSRSEIGAINLPRLVVEDEVAKEDKVRAGIEKDDSEGKEGNDKKQKDSVGDGTKLGSQSNKLKSNFDATSTTAAQSKPNSGNTMQTTKLKLTKTVAFKRKLNEDEVG